MKKGDVWIVDLPEGRGHEQKGRRPAIILSNANGIITVIPLTSNLAAARFSFTVLIEPNLKNVLTKDSVALVFQIVSLDASCFKYKIGTITKEQQDSIDQLILDMLKINVK